MEKDIFATRVGSATIGEHLARAEREGLVVRNEDGRYSPPPRTDLDAAGVITDRPAVVTPGHFKPRCDFLAKFLFTAVYGGEQVPFGCRACYKVVTVPQTYHQFMLARPLAAADGHLFKASVEALSPRNDRAYAIIMYVEGLEAARVAYQNLRQRLDDHPELGEEVTMFIRRGCAGYEKKCGPSDQYDIPAQLEALEAALEPLYAPPPKSGIPRALRRGATELRMLAIAEQIGDRTSRRYSGQKKPYPFVTYEPADVRPPGSTG